MKRRVHITAVRKDPPELDRFVAALLAFALARIEAERKKREVGEQADREGDHG